MRLSRAESGGDRQLGLGQRIDLQLLELQLQAAELHALVGDHRAGDRHGRLDRQRGDALVELARRIVLGQHDLRETAFRRAATMNCTRFWSRRACTQPRSAHALADQARQLALSACASRRDPIQARAGIRSDCARRRTRKGWVLRPADRTPRSPGARASVRGSRERGHVQAAASHVGQPQRPVLQQRSLGSGLACAGERQRQVLVHASRLCISSSSSAFTLTG